VTPDVPPLVTIVDPAAPARSRDVLGHEPREPWRPTRRQVLLAVVAIVVLTLLAGAARTTRQQHADRTAVARARAELGGVHLAVPPDGAVAGYSQAGFDNGTNNAAQSTAGTATAIVELQLNNMGRTPVELQDGVLDVPGWAVQAEGLLTTGQPADLHLVRHVVCAQELRSPAPEPTALLLDVRLPSGRSLRTRVPLPRLDASGAPSAVGLAATLHEVPRRACGLLPPGQALEVTGQGAPVTRAGSVEVRLQLRNSGAVSLRLSGLRALPGLAVRAVPPLPFDLAPHAAVLTTLMVTVDCHRASGLPAGAGGSLVQVLLGSSGHPQRLELGALAELTVRQLVSRRCG